MKSENKKIIIGQEERISLPSNGIIDIPARIDTGAKTSSIHAKNIRYEEENGITMVIFDFIAKNKDRALVTTTVRSELHTKRKIKTHSGSPVTRPYIVTELKFGDITFEAELNLSNRSHMKYKLLIGREVLKNRFIVDVNRSNIL